jgi:hypothetical protein
MPLFFTDNFSKFKKHKRASLLFILPLLSIFVFLISPCFAAVNSTKEPVVTIAAKSEPLKMVLKKISNATGYKIEVTEGWENRPVTVDIHGLTLDDSLNKIIRALGNPNNAKINYDNKKVIRINFFDTSKEVSLAQNNNAYNQLQVKQAEAVLNMENMPPIGNEKIAKDSSSSKIDPLDIEILPPSKPGGKGITQRELLKMQGEKKEINPLDIEVLPPSKPGEKGITQREIQGTQEYREKIDPLDIEVIPPANPGEKGLTVRDLQRVEKKLEKIVQKDRDLLPTKIPEEEIQRLND